MRVFVSEYICGGAWPEPALDNSLAVEGRAMLIALVRDLLRINGVHVVTAWDSRLGDFPLSDSRCEVVRVSSAAGEAKLFDRLCEESDVAFVIAPEFHSILTERVTAAAGRTRLIGCDIDATALCSDKLKLAEFLLAAEIPTIPTESFDLSGTKEATLDRTANFPSVIKPRDGAGSLLTFKVSDPDELAECTRQLLAVDENFDFVRQRFIEGVAVSCAAIVSVGQGATSGELRVEVLPPCAQVLSGDGKFTYEGAEFPIQVGGWVDKEISKMIRAEISPSFPRRRESSGNDMANIEPIEHLVRRCCSAIPGLNGYVGFDLLLPQAKDAEPIVVEINPRLTTGFLLWQKMCNDNLVARMLAPNHNAPPIESPLSWDLSLATFRINSLPD